MGICLPKKVARVCFHFLLGSQELFPWKGCHKLNPYIVTRGTAVMVSVLFCQHVLYVRVLRINRVCSKEIKAVSYSQWQPTRWPFLPRIPLSTVLTLPPDGWVCPLEEHGIPRSSCPRCFRAREPHGTWASLCGISFQMGEDARSCLVLRKFPAYPVCGRAVRWHCQQGPCCRGDPSLPSSSYAALFSTDAKGVCLRSQWICHRNLLYWDYMCY